MRLGDVAEGAFLILVLGTAIYMGHRSKPSPQPVVAAPVDSFANFCSRAHLVPKAFDDCRKAMDAAKNDTERMTIEHRFAMGNVQLDEPRSTAQP